MLVSHTGLQESLGPPHGWRCLSPSRKCPVRCQGPTDDRYCGQKQTRLAETVIILESVICRPIGGVSLKNWLINNSKNTNHFWSSSVQFYQQHGMNCVHWLLQSLMETWRQIEILPDCQGWRTELCITSLHHYSTSIPLWNQYLIIKQTKKIVGQRLESSFHTAHTKEWCVVAVKSHHTCLMFYFKNISICH